MRSRSTIIPVAARCPARTLATSMHRPDPDLEVVIAAMMDVTGSATRADLLSKLPVTAKQSIEAVTRSGVLLDYAGERRFFLSGKLAHLSSYLEAEVNAK